MNRIVLFLIVFSFAFNSSYAQNSLNDYKYVIVPVEYDFLGEEDKYQLNSLTKFLFNKYGFESIMSNEDYPSDLKKDVCKALSADVLNQSGFLKTKLEIELRDCKNQLVFSTKIGETRVKDYKKAYNLALRDAFTSFETINYKYNSKISDTATVKPESKATAAKVAPEIIEEPVREKKVVDKKNEPIRYVTPESREDIELAEKTFETVKVISKNTFTAKEIFNGYQLLDKSSNQVMTIFDSGAKDVFIVKGKDAIIYKKGDKWIYSETNETNLLTKLINIKF